MKVLGVAVEVTEQMDCERHEAGNGGRHRQLVHDARVDCSSVR